MVKSGMYPDKINDGFNYLPQNYFISSNDIISKLNEADNKIKVYYLHGSSFIINKTINNSTHEKLFMKLNHLSINPFNILYDKHSHSDELPALIIEPNWKTKKGLIENYPYLSYCKKKFIDHTNCKDLLITGVSFKNDAHILHFLVKKALYMADHKIYITFLKNDENNFSPKSYIEHLEILLKKELNNLNVHTKGISNPSQDYSSLIQKIIPVAIDIDSIDSKDPKKPQDIKGFFWEEKTLSKKILKKFKSFLDS